MYVSGTARQIIEPSSSHIIEQSDGIGEVGIGDSLERTGAHCVKSSATMDQYRHTNRRWLQCSVITSISALDLRNFPRNISSTPDPPL